MSAPPSGGGTPIENRRQLIEYFAAGNKPPTAWRMGTEHEKFGFHTATLKPLAYDGPDGIRAMLEGMTRFGWEPVVEGNNPIALQRANASITLEPGGQFELSGAPLETLHETAAENAQHLDEVKQVAGEIGAGFIGLGFAPEWTREDMHWMPKGRYKIMRDYMPKKGKLGLDMMLRTCTVQTNLDFESEADMVKKFRVSLALQPLATALFANSPFKEGKAVATRATAATSGPTPIPTVAACCPSSSRTASASSATSTTCWACRCTSSIAMASTSMPRAKASRISSRASYRRGRASCRP